LLPQKTKLKILRPVILHAISYWCITWSLTIKGKTGALGVSEWYAEKGIRPKRQKVTSLGKFHYEELHDC
jgi:hypothetical protein